jgi:hypothetical protein
VSQRIDATANSDWRKSEELVDGAFPVVAYVRRAVGKLQHGSNDMETRNARDPSDPREARQVEVVVLVAQRRGDPRLADAGPQVRRIRGLTGRHLLRRI